MADKLDWTDIQSADYGLSNPGSFTLSLESVKLLLALLNSRAIHRGAWVVGGDKPSNSEWNDIQEFVSGAIDALFLGGMMVILEDQKTAGTNGGTFTSGAWRTRDLNTIVHDDVGITLSSNEFTLPAGRYPISVDCPVYATQQNRCRVYNVSDTAIEIEGSNAYGSTTTVQGIARLTGLIDISSSKTFRVEHRCRSTRAANGFGVEVNTYFTVPYEIYTKVVIQKI